MLTITFLTDLSRVQFVNNTAFTKYASFVEPAVDDCLKHLQSSVFYVKPNQVYLSANGDLDITITVREEIDVKTVKQKKEFIQALQRFVNDCKTLINECFSTYSFTNLIPTNRKLLFYDGVLFADVSPQNDPMEYLILSVLDQDFDWEDMYEEILSYYKE